MKEDTLQEMPNLRFKRQWIFVCLSMILLCVTPVFSAQSILLKNGKVLKGSVIDQNESSITVRFSNGKTETLQKRSVLKVIYKDVSQREAEKIRKQELAKERAELQRKREAEQREKARKEEEAKKQAEEKRLAAEKERQSREQNQSIPENNVDGLQVLWRDAVLPGYGQWYAGYRIQDWGWTHYIAPGLFWVSVLAGVEANNEYQTAKHSYQSKTKQTIALQEIGSAMNGGGIGLTEVLFLKSQRDTSFHKYKTASNSYNATLGAVGLMYVTQLAIGYFWGGKFFSPSNAQSRFWEFRPFLDKPGRVWSQNPTGFGIGSKILFSMHF